MFKGKEKMSSKIIDFLYRVRGNFSPNGLPKVFLSFHPADVVITEQVSKDILSIANCAIYYHTETLSEENLNLEDFSLKLREMQLFVVIITTKYLMNSSLSKSWNMVLL